MTFDSPPPATPTHRLRPAEPSFSASIASLSDWMEQSPCATPNTPRRRLAALLDTPISTADPLMCGTPNKGSRRRSDHSACYSSPKRRLLSIAPLDSPCESPISCPSPSPSLKRKQKISISHPLSARRKQKQSVKQSLFPPLMNDSKRFLEEASWSTFPDLSSNDLDYYHVEPAGISMAKARAVVDKAQQFVDDQNRYKNELDKCIKRFQRVARARLKSGNETGAILAAKKVKKIENEQGRVAKAVLRVTNALTELEEEMRRANDARKTVCFGENLNVLEEAEAILSKRPENKWDKEKLLAEIQRWAIPTLAV